VDLGRLGAPALAALVLLAAPAAEAATVALEGTAVRVVAAPGEENRLAVAAAFDAVSVTDPGAPLAAGSGCELLADGSVSCSVPPGTGIEVDAGDLDDLVSVAAAVGAVVNGGEGDDQLFGGGADDLLVGGGGRDFVNGGAGADSLELRDGIADSAWCGPGRDAVTTEVLDALERRCERVDHGRAGSAGRVLRRTGGARLVRVPGQTWAHVDRRILPDVLYMVRRHHVRITEGYGTVGHELFGEHPLGLAVDIEPGAGGTWADVSRLARWAEPRQNRPRRPFRWVGWNGDFNHGHPSLCRRSRGCAPHLHLSWRHSPARPRSLARTVWVFDVR
jgi:RTX calcium-binding nonapeptide repeat (4 copies)